MSNQKVKKLDESGLRSLVRSMLEEGPYHEEGEEVAVPRFSSAAEERRNARLRSRGPNKPTDTLPQWVPLTTKPRLEALIDAIGPQAQRHAHAVESLTSLCSKDPGAMGLLMALVGDLESKYGI
jgi:hypothetical protein